MKITIPPPSMANEDIVAGQQSRHLFFSEGHDTFLASAKNWAGDNRSIESPGYLVIDLAGVRLSKKQETVNAASAQLKANVRFEDVHSAIFERGMLRYLDSGVMALTQAYGLQGIKDGKINPLQFFGCADMPPIPRRVLRTLFDDKIKAGLMGARRDIAVVGHVINAIADSHF